jgi:hypothetical protein
VLDPIAGHLLGDLRDGGGVAQRIWLVLLEARRVAVVDAAEGSCLTEVGG